MSKNSDIPYGPGYQTRVAKVAREAGCKGNTMGILFCLFSGTKFDWFTGETRREISHEDIAEEMGCCYDTVRKCLRELRGAGIITYARKGVVWSNGDGKANRYRWAIPPSVGGGEKTPTPPGKKRPAPRGKNTHHYHSSILPNGDEASASRRQEAKPRAKTPEEQAQFSQLEREYSYGYALSWWKDLLKKETEAAE